MALAFLVTDSAMETVVSHDDIDILPYGYETEASCYEPYYFDSGSEKCLGGKKSLVQGTKHS